MVKRGIRQGDPLSPLLFNMVIDYVIERIESAGLGFSWFGIQTGVLAFADDLVLLTDNKDKMQRALDILVEELLLIGLNLSIEKCVTF